MTDDTTPMDTSSLTWNLDDFTRVRPLIAGDAEEMFTLIVTSREHLDRWLRWSNTLQAEADVTDTITAAAAKQQAGIGFHLGIFVHGALAGGAVCRDLLPLHRSAEIGYWLGHQYTGRGLATRATVRVIDYLIDERKLHRIEMQCASENVASRAIPERLGFQLEGIRRQSHWITSCFMDHAVYGLLDDEWPAARTRSMR